MATTRNWSGDDYQRAQAENESLERAMRSILKLFAEGCLVYKKRETTVRVDIGSRSDRVRRLRRQATPAETPAVAT